MNKNKIYSFRSRIKLVGLILLLILAGYYCFIKFSGRISTVGKRPNIIFVMTDDESVHEAKIVKTVMPNLYRSVIEKSVEFTNFTCSSPYCAPSRASLLTGLMPSKNGYLNNDGKIEDFLAKYDQNSLGKLMQDQGYYTVYIGKYLNPYRTKKFPIGWDQIYISRGGFSSFNHLSLTDITFPFDTCSNCLKSEYETDLITQFLKFYKSQKIQKPLFLFYSPLEPHGSPVKYMKIDKDAYASFEAVVKFDSLKIRPKRDSKGVLVNKINSGIRLRDHAMLSEMELRVKKLNVLDQNLNKVWEEMKRIEIFESSYIFYTSDNGFHLGEKNLWAKRSPYLESIEVPFYVKLPNGKLHSKNGKLISTVDLLATFLNISNPSIVEYADGITIFSSNRKEVWSEMTNSLNMSNALDWVLFRTDEMIAIKFEDNSYELYDLTKDPNLDMNIFSMEKHFKIMEKLNDYKENERNLLN